MHQQSVTLLFRFKQWIRGEGRNRTFQPQKDDDARRSYVFRIILLGIIPISAVATLYVFSSRVFLHQVEATVPFWLIGSVDVALLFFFYASYSYGGKYVRYAFVLMTFFLALYTSIAWGVNVPMSFLSYGLAITFAGILLDTSWALALVFSTIVSISIIFYLQDRKILEAYELWKLGNTSFMDILIYSGILGVIGITTWLSNREIEHAAQELQKERDSLEQKVHARTQELEQTNSALHKADIEFRRIQKEKFIEVNNLAALGKITTGLIHDIANPLTYVAAAIETRQKQSVKTVHEGLQEIASLIDSTRKQIRKHVSDEEFSPAKEITQSCKFLHYEAQKKHIKYVCELNALVILHGDPAKFHQCISNIVLNAIEAYPSPKKHSIPQTISVHMKNMKSGVLIEITDQAGGIPKKYVPFIFQPFFTTKQPKEGTGIGLAAVKDIVENMFHGTLSFQTIDGKGTTFRMSFPYTSDHRPAKHSVRS
ncbi:MAG TPA: hypothetical protein DCX25_02295 [Candidatus Pacebacteria bacterium]|nr:MAG: Multi-sensor Hybrid Histidine Kinase [Microgenomates group bacterium GW2011_GWB1_45_17]KKU24537.1 MAG: Multi-sensor Hybrid Histidine Kinase [Microgenomates group bacterium GW2011_GWC1_46_15]HAV15133.1 hypothetical protein [Candidatus Paceibacterota bacterium]HCR11039.1 hypothetical protein [Candidatus Paceibacterota bacterium]